MNCQGAESPRRRENVQENLATGSHRLDRSESLICFICSDLWLILLDVFFAAWRFDSYVTASNED